MSLKLDRWTCFRRILGFLEDTKGQDLIEYALMAAAVAVGAGALIPPVGNSMNSIFSKILSIAARTPG